MTERVVVVAAVIEEHGKFLVARRLAGTHLAGFWEFPGGKVHEGETHDQALRREIAEELKTGISNLQEIFHTSHSYPERTVELHFYRGALTGAPQPALGQELQWISREEFAAMEFPPADASLIAALIQRTVESGGPMPPVRRQEVDRSKLNRQAELPYELRVEDFALAMQDVYDFFHDVNHGLVHRGLERLDDMLRPAIMSGLLSDMLTASMAKHSRALTANCYFNGHPDLVVQGVYPENCVKAGTEGVEIKTTRKAGGAVDTHGARDQHMCVFVYTVDTESEPARERNPMIFTEVYLGKVSIADFRRNPRGELGTRTATLHRDGIEKLRKNWVYKLNR